MPEAFVFAIMWVEIKSKKNCLLQTPRYAHKVANFDSFIDAPSPTRQTQIERALL